MCRVSLTFYVLRFTLHGGILIAETWEGMPVIENERQQRMVERVQEDERLRSDLPDDAAAALVEWAGKHVAAAAADPARPDAEVEAEVQAIRAAVRAAARAGEDEPQRLIALAETELAQRTASPAPPAAAAPAVPPHADNLAAAVGASSATRVEMARPQPPAPSLPVGEPSAGVSQPPAPSEAQASQ